MSSWTAASSDCSRPVNNYVHVKTADLYRPNARLTPERQGYQVLTPFGKLGYSRGFDEIRSEAIALGQRARMEKTPGLGLLECGRKIDAIEGEIGVLREKLTRAYEATYE